MAQTEEANPMLASPANSVETPNGQTDKDKTSDKVQMKKEIGLLEGVAIILGIIIGSGKTSLEKAIFSV